MWHLMENASNLILEEQARYFEKTIKGVLYAKIINARLKSNADIQIQEYKLATSFNIVSPVLDNYTYTLFTVYSNPESNYPIAISVNNNEDYIDLDYTCNNKTEFIRDLSKILSSDKVTEIIEVIYSKSKNF